jgi:hypothetical protein
MMSGFCSTALIACFVLGGSNAFAQTSYKVTDLGVLSSKEEGVRPAANAFTFSVTRSHRLGCVEAGLQMMKKIAYKR